MITPKITNLGYSNLWSDMSTILGYASNFDQQIQKLYANNEQGFFYDPNDLSTMFRDAAGTVPVTGAGQPVGLILDKSKGLVLGVEKLSNNDFSNNGVGWVIAGGVPTYAGGVVTLTTQAGGTGEIYQDISVPVGRLVKITARAKYSNAQSFGLNVYDGGGYTNHKGVIVFGTSFEEKSGYFFSTTGSLRVRMRLATSTTTGTCDVDYISVKEIAGNHAYQTTSASRPILRQNASTGAYYLEFDGSDDFLRTNNIDFTATDKVSLFAGVRKLSDVATGIVAELSQNSLAVETSGVFAIMGTHSNLANWASRSRGTAFADAISPSNYVAPISSVITSLSSISDKFVSLRAGGKLVTSSSLTQGTGTYGNYPLYIGRRAGTSLPFNGHIYGLIGIGKLTSDNETAAIEKELAKRLGVTLNV